MTALLAGVVLGAVGVGGLLLLYIFHNVHKVEQWAALFHKALSAFPRIFRGARKRYIKHDLQGRVNEFTAGLTKEAPFLAQKRVKLEFVDGDVDEGRLRDGDVLLRLRNQDREERNFARAAYLFVSTSLVYRVKKYISPSQKEAVDLYVTTKLLEKEKPQVVSAFVDEYLHPKTQDPDSKVSTHFESFAHIDEHGFFYPVLLQELDFLGNKVFGGRKDQRIIGEVTELIEFLIAFCNRTVGEEVQMSFCRDYCKFGLVIIGKAPKIQYGSEQWVRYVNKNLTSRDAETIYLLGKVDNQPTIDAVVAALEPQYDLGHKLKTSVKVRYSDGNVQALKQYIVVLRKKDIPVYQAAS